ncbi:MAG: ROK family transcriptional regulator [Clostridia bacterium]|nr:ROK family transcriptional regulator [Clostridia bacterium]
MKQLDQTSIRKQNVRKILELLTLNPPRTRQSLAEATGLSLMTVTNLVDQLKERQVLDILPAPRPASERRASGRKAELISLRSGGHAWMIIDLSGRNFRYSLLGFDLSLIMEKTCTAQGEYLVRLRAFLDDIRQDVAGELKKRTLLGVSVVTPGPYEIASDTVYNQRLPELNAIRIKEELRSALGDYDYYVDEDVKFAVRAFASLIEQEQCELLYYLFIGEGVGGAAVHSGNMLRGHNATAGDAGQLTTPDGATYESLLSLSAFAASLGVSAQDSKEMTAGLAQAAQAQPVAYLTALLQAADTAGDMLHNVLWVLDPSHIIIDCRYARPFEDAFLRRISEKLSMRTASAGRKLPMIVAAPKGISSVTRGAVQVLQREWVERMYE